jgi:putative lysine transport system permease protein
MIFTQLPPKNEFFQTVIYLLKTYDSFFIRGVMITLLLSIVGTIGGFLLSLVLTIIRMQKIDNRRDNLITKVIKKTSQGFTYVYITVFRGTPMIVQAMIFYYGLAPLRIPFWEPLLAGLIVVTLNTTAYIAEVIRSGINGIDKGQLEAARSLGFSFNQSMFRIVLPQAIKNSLPAIGNEFIVNLKDTAVLSVIGVVDLFKSTQQATSGNFRLVEGFFIAAIIYLMLTAITSRIVHHLEHRQSKTKVVVEHV